MKDLRSWFGFLLRLVHSGLGELLLKIRSAYFRSLFGTCGPGLRVYGRLVVYSPQNVFLGRGCTLNEGVILNATGGTIEFSDYVTVSPGAMLQCGGLNLDNAKFPRSHEYSAIHIGKGCWIASGAHILNGISIGDYSVVAANSVVTHSVPSGILVAGVPAKVIRLISVEPVALPK